MNKANLSYWEQETFFKDIDIVVIGSGIVGLTAAIHLKKKDPTLRVLVIERGPLPIGASTRNAGFACFGSLSELLDDLQKHSESEVFELLEKRWSGLAKLKANLGESIIDYREWGAYEIFRPHEQENFNRCKEQINYFNQQLEGLIGRKEVYQVADDRIASFGFRGVSHLILNSAEGQIHTGKMMQALLDRATEHQVRVINGVEIENWEEDQMAVWLNTAQGWKIKCQKVLIATNGFARTLLPSMDVQPARNQVLISKPLQALPFKGCFHYDSGYYYFRNIDNRILLGGGRNLDLEAEQTTEFGKTTLITEALLRLLREVIYPHGPIEVEQYWSGILGVGSQKKPIISQYSERIYTAVRMGGMGVAIGSLIGEEGAELLL